MLALRGPGAEAHDRIRNGERSFEVEGESAGGVFSPVGSVHRTAEMRRCSRLAGMIP